MPLILFISTGGTIASVNSQRGLYPSLNSDRLLQYVPEVSSFCDIEAKQLFSLDSTDIMPSHWLAIASEIRENYNKYDGFVISHGTDTLAYTAAALSYLIQNSQKPIVITGSQIPISEENSDGKKNLSDSFKFASMSQNAGVFVVFGGKAIHGTRARKMRSKSFAAFESINLPPACEDIDGLTLAHDIQVNLKDVKFYNELDSSVCLIKLIPGMSSDILHYAGECNRAIVIESFGSGGLPSGSNNEFLSAVKELSKAGKSIVFASQVALEGTNLVAYSVGRQVAYLDGVLQTCDMNIDASLVKLMWILPQCQSQDEVKKLFYTPVAYDINPEICHEVNYI